MASSGTAGTGSPCGACKFLRRKCSFDCIFAPYFCSEQGPGQFAAIHKVFGASNVSKLLLHVPVADRSEAVVTISYEAQARIRDPVYGCVAHIFALQQQVAMLQAQLMQVKAKVAHNNTMDSRGSIEINHHQCQWQGNTNGVASFPSNYPAYSRNPISPQSSSLELVDHNNEGMNMQEIENRSYGFLFQGYPQNLGKRPCNTDFGELQALALRMMRNW